MTAQTKQIMITTNADVIRQFSSTTLPNTIIIDLNNCQQVHSKTNANDIDFTFLEQLTQFVRFSFE